MPRKHLTEELKRDIEKIVSSLSIQNFYTILGLQEDATKEEIKKSYFLLSKDFHPDTFYGEDLGGYQKHLEVIFRSITRAHDVLSNPNKRERYNKYLEQKKDVKGMEKAASDEMREVKERVMQRTGIIPVISMAGAAKEAEEPPQPAVSSTPSKPPAAVDRFDRSALDRTASKHKKWRRKRLMSLLNIQDARVQQQKVSESAGKKIQELLKSAEEAEKEENYLGAINALKLAIMFDPENKDLQDRFNQVLSKISPVLGQKYYSIGLSEEEFGDMEAAVGSFERAVEYCPDNPEYIYRLSNAIMEGDGDLHKAYDYCKKAIKFSSTEAEYYLLLGKICIKAGLVKSAETALKTCLEHDTKNSEARRLLKQL